MVSFVIDNYDTLTFNALFQDTTQHHAIVFLVFLSYQLSICPFLLAVKRRSMLARKHTRQELLVIDNGDAGVKATQFFLKLRWYQSTLMVVVGSFVVVAALTKV